MERSPVIRSRDFAGGGDRVSDRDDIDSGVSDAGAVVQPPGRMEKLRIISARIRNTATCLVVYVVLVVLNVFLLLWEVLGGESHWTLIGFEAMINFILVLEVTIGILTEGRDYFRTWLNRVDVFVTICCLLFFVLLLVENENAKEDQDFSFIDSAVLSIRYIVQIGRLGFIAYRGRKTTTFLHQEDITFTDLDDRLPPALNVLPDDDGEEETLISHMPRGKPQSGSNISVVRIV